MKNKWYLVAFVIALAIVGISLEQSAVPNQEIRIQFSDTEAKKDQTQDAISLVKSQLKALHIDDLRIEELANGTLKVSYYSGIDVSEIKKILSEAIEAGRNNNSYSSHNSNNELPFEKKIEPYHLDIYKIKDANDFNGATSGVLDSKSETTRSSSFKTYATVSKLLLKEKNNTNKSTYDAHKIGAVAINNSSHKIPESRAGPVS